MYSLSCAVYDKESIRGRKKKIFFFSILELFLHHHVTFAMPSGHFSCVSGKTSLKSECSVKCSDPDVNMLSAMKSSSGLFWILSLIIVVVLFGAGFVAPFRSVCWKGPPTCVEKLSAHFYFYHQHPFPPTPWPCNRKWLTPLPT